MENLKIVNTNSTVMDENGNKFTLQQAIMGNEEHHATIKDFAEYLNKLVEFGYGDYLMYADTQDSDSYKVRCRMLVSPPEFGFKHAEII